MTDIFGRGDPSPTAFSYFLIVGEAFRLPFFDLHHCSVVDLIGDTYIQTSKGNIATGHIKPYTNTFRKFFWFFSFKKRT